MQVTPFNFNTHEIRTVTIDGEPWFIAKDVCNVLEVSNVSDALSRLDDDEKGIGLTDTLGGKQEMSIINESGLYSLTLSSRKPEAKAFKKWVTSEVLPAIRKTGSYSLKKQLSPAEMFVAQAQLNLDIERRQLALEERTDSMDERLKAVEDRTKTVTKKMPDGFDKRESIYLAAKAMYGGVASKVVYHVLNLFCDDFKDYYEAPYNDGDTPMVNRIDCWNKEFALNAIEQFLKESSCANRKGMFAHKSYPKTFNLASNFREWHKPESGHSLDSQ